MNEITGTTKISSDIYERILYSVPDLIFVFDKDGFFLNFYNENSKNYYLKAKEFIGKHISETNLPEKIKNTTVLTIKKVIEKKQEKKFQYSLDIEEETKHYEARLLYLDVDKVVAIIRDISSIKRSEIIQKQLKQYYQLILDRLDRGVIETDTDGKIKYINKAFSEISRYKKNDLIGKNFFSFFGLQKEKENLTEYYIHNSHRKHFKNNYSFISNFLGNITDKDFKINIISNNIDQIDDGILNIEVIDITADRRKQELLKKSENTYRSLVEFSPNGILIRDEKNILYANPAAIQILGFKDLDQAQKFRIQDLYLPEFIPAVQGRLNDLKKGKKVPYLEVKIKRPIDGKIIEVETIPAKIYYEGSEAFQIVIKDISIQKHLLETKLRADLAEESYDKLRREIVIRQEAEQKLSKSLEEKSILLKEVHHRVKNNLQIISSILNLEIRSHNDMNVSQTLKRIQNRIYSIYLTHEIAYQTDMFSRIDLGQYVQLISENIIRNSEYENLRIEHLCDKVYVSLEIGVPIGMIINELLYNFFDNHTVFNEKCPIKISIKQKNMQTEIEILYPDLISVERKIKGIDSSLSSQLVEALVDQINGTYRIESEDQKNIKFVLYY
jgi:PAS domain S-box-containing protein